MVTEKIITWMSSLLPCGTIRLGEGLISHGSKPRRGSLRGLAPRRVRICSMIPSWMLAKQLICQCAGKQSGMGTNRQSRRRVSHSVLVETATRRTQPQLPGSCTRLFRDMVRDHVRFAGAARVEGRQDDMDNYVSDRGVLCHCEC
jgi:hypothetical protein